MMNFVCNFYFFIIIILRSRGVVQTAADFTLKELKYVSGKLKPMECMRLIEAIYSAIPYGNGREHKLVTRETPVNAWISEHACLDELRTWSREIPEKTEPKARRVMVLHLNAIGRSDLGNYLRKNDPKRNGRILKRFAMRNKLHKARTESKTRKVRHVVKKRLTESSSETWTDTVSKNLLISSTVLCLAVTSCCGILMFVIRKRVKSSTCCKKNSNSRQPGSIIRTQEKGLQCIGCLQDDYLKRVETESKASQISEIDIEGGSYDQNFTETGTQRSISGSIMSDGNETLRVSIEKLKLINEKPKVQSTKESPLNNSCSSRRSPERKTHCEPKQRKTKKRKKKVKVKAKGESRSPKGYLKVIREKILPSKEKRKHKTPNKNSGVCQYCNCTGSLHRQEADGDRVRKKSEKWVKQEAGSKPKREKRMKYPKNKKDEDRKSILAHEYDSVASGSPKLDKQLKQAKTKRLKVLSRRPGASRARKVRLLSSSSETEAQNVGD